MAVGYDSTEPFKIPTSVPDPNYAFGYVDGLYASSFGEMGMRFPTATHVPITAIPNSREALTAIISDGERFDYTPEQSAAFSAQKLEDNIVPGCYCSLSNWSSYIQAHSAIGVDPADVDWWIAAYPGNGPSLYKGSIGHQYADMGTYDLSVILDGWQPGRPYHIPTPTPDPSPTPDPQPTNPQEYGMVARNTKGTGYWAVRPSGAVYAFDGAPYLGPNPSLRQQWGIGTPENPVVGIVDDGNGGYVLVADNNKYPGTPALYHIDSSGQYK